MNSSTIRVCRKAGLSITRHQEIGLELARMRDRLAEIGAEIANAYQKNSKAARFALRMTQPLDQLRCELDDRMFAEHHGDERATAHVYYPRPDARAGGPDCHHGGHVVITGDDRGELDAALAQMLDGFNQAERAENELLPGQEASPTPGHAESANDALHCVTVAAAGAVTDYGDVLTRGYLKEHPAGVLYRLSTLEGLIKAVRTAAERELEGGAWDGTDPFSPADEHHKLVAEFAEHVCDCEWCLSPGGRRPYDLQLDDPWADAAPADDGPAA